MAAKQAIAALAPVPEAVTVAAPVTGLADLLQIRSGVPVSEALDALSMLLGNIADSLTDTCIAMNGGDPTPPWASLHLLSVADAIASSAQSGVAQHHRQLAEASRPNIPTETPKE